MLLQQNDMPNLGSEASVDTSLLKEFKGKEGADAAKGRLLVNSLVKGNRKVKLRSWLFHSEYHYHHIHC